jgi:uncharacterized membrane protein YedE/YeeE
MLVLQAQDLWVLLRRYASIQADRSRAFLVRMLVLVMVGLAALVASLAVAVMTCWLLLSGMAGGLAEVLGSVWLGRLAAGIAVILGVAATVLVAATVRASRATRRARFRHETTASERQSEITAPASSHGA